ncbi:multiple epidermal growth factor-like domains protein 11 [Biomphalaria pfeifferi]|uniref:Multiple epidermal growth factor-like domains protein 11 n=1 Tax=Biomphalaria pfeifferi TaxID=112525 RepID=A0AAD8AWV3_BIOPF|nr:multiple epidermal growth factor-like domains protein 11 [Biomphalaria pfeifferi]
MASTRGTAQLFSATCFLSIYLLHTVSACDKGWFGSSCQYKCRCDSCDPVGHCTGSSKCLNGWFGPSCQYQNLAIPENMEPSVNKVLVDQNDDTCDGHLQGAVLDWKGSAFYPVTWIRLTFKDRAVSNFTLSFEALQSAKVNQSPRNIYTTCSKETIVLSNSRTLDIFCESAPTVYSVRLQEAGIESLCSVYISGGRNVALRQNTWMSSVSSLYSKTAASVVDGVGHNSSAATTCVSTSQEDRTPRLIVTMARPVYFSRYILVNPAPTQMRSNSLQVEAFTLKNVIIENHISANQKPPSKMTVITPRQRDSVNRLEITSLNGTLWLCEVEIYGDVICPTGTYGLDCDMPCHCANATETCFVSTGQCRSGCARGTQGEGCTQACGPGQHGVDCKEQCSQNCVHKICNGTTGQCLSCVHGFTGDTCNQACAKGYYGPNCVHTCPQNCQDMQCNAVDGHCLTCVSGYQGVRCERACGPGQHGVDCKEQCSQNCVDNKCNGTTGQCLSCVDGFTGDTCNQVCAKGYYGPNCVHTCPQNCQDMQCNAIDGHCLTCVSGYQGLRCERACGPGQHGVDCNEQCPPNCHDKKCNGTTGQCLSCVHGFTGDKCNQVCTQGYYGTNCVHSCPQNCQDMQCNAIDGHCLTCVSGYQGVRCERECNKGHYGVQCNYSCPENCKNKTCHASTGQCFQCVPGYRGDKCQEACDIGYHGALCSQTCPKQCNNSHCNVTTGLCLGCQDGYYGDACDQVCVSGSYGRDCSMNCSDVCNVPTCHHVTGACPADCVDPNSEILCQHALTSTVLNAEADSINWTLVIIALVISLAFTVVAAIVVVKYRSRCKKQWTGHVTYQRTPSEQNAYIQAIDWTGSGEHSDHFDGFNFDNTFYDLTMVKPVCSSWPAEESSKSLLLGSGEGICKGKSQGSSGTACWSEGQLPLGGQSFESCHKLYVDMSGGQENIYERIDDGHYDCCVKNFAEEQVYEHLS